MGFTIIIFISVMIFEWCKYSEVTKYYIFILRSEAEIYLNKYSGEIIISDIYQGNKSY